MTSPELITSLEHPYRQDIDGLRAIAILSVVVFHAFPKILTGGFIGVDIFFVISGFLISGVLLDSLNKYSFSLLDFYSRRILRIFPALIIVLVATYAYGWFHLMAEEYASLGKHIAGGAGFISNFILWNESGYFDKNATLKPLLNLWSLGIEEQYYIVWPFLLWAFFRFKWSIRWLILTCLIISFGINLNFIKNDPTGTFYAPWTRVWELLIGAFLAYDQTQSTRSSLQTLLNKVSINSLSILGISLFFIGFALIDSSQNFPGWWGLLPTLGTFLLIAVGPKALINRSLLSNPLMVGIGKISYPLYLWHWPILVFAGMRLDHPPSHWYQFVCVVLAIGLSILTYFGLEKPIRFIPKHRQLKTGLLVFLMVLIGFIGFNCYSRGGIEYRHKDFIKQVSGYQFDKVKEQRQHECFVMDKSDSLSHFSTTCIHNSQSTKIVLWGDSHGGSIYPGFAELERDYPVSVSQFTIAGCGGVIPDRTKEIGNSDPVLKFCNDANQVALDQIIKLHPQLVVIHKSWQTDMLGPIEKTIQIFQENRIKVALIGPTPVWTQDLPRIIYRHWKIHQALPSPYFDQYLNPDVPQMEESLKAIAQKYHITYYSAYQRLCNHQGCLVMIPDTDHALTTMDQGHITPAAGRYVVKGFAQENLKPYLNEIEKN